MSVAFRRESDDEHLEPKFERPIAPGPNLVTPRGLDLIVAEVARLEHAIAATPDEADAEPLKRDLRYWKTRRATAEIAPTPPEGEVGIGSRVTLCQNGQRRTVEIVGGDEADPSQGRIGFQAPLARALIGGFEGESVAFAGATLLIEEID